MLSALIGGYLYSSVRGQAMKPVTITRLPMLVVLLAISLGSTGTVRSAQTIISGIVDYVYEPNPQQIKPKMYNWQIQLNPADSRNGSYEIIQVTWSGKANPKATTTVLIDSKMIVPNRDGIIAFSLNVGDKEPKQNMGRRGHSGQPIIFSGRGTGKAASNWMVLPGTKVDRVVPSPKGAQLRDGKLDLLRLIVSNESGEEFRVDVMLRRE